MRRHIFSNIQKYVHSSPHTYTQTHIYTQHESRRGIWGTWGPAISKEEGPKMVVGKKMSPVQRCICMSMSYKILSYCMLTKNSENKTKWCVVLYPFRDRFLLRSRTFFSRASYSTLHTSWGLAPISAWSSISFSLTLVLGCSLTIPLTATSNSTCHSLLE